LSGCCHWLLVRQSDSTSSTAAFAGNDPSIALVLAKVTTGVEFVRADALTGYRLAAHCPNLLTHPLFALGDDLLDHT